MNELFGIDVRKQLFPLVKRKRVGGRSGDGGTLGNPGAAPSESGESSVLANLPTGDTLITKQSRSNQSVLANLRSPRANKELKETSSSLMIMTLNSDKQDVSVSVFELLSRNCELTSHSRKKKLGRSKQGTKRTERIFVMGQQSKRSQGASRTNSQQISVLAGPLPVVEKKELIRRGKRDRDTTSPIFVKRKQAQKSAPAPGGWYDALPPVNEDKQEVKETRKEIECITLTTSTIPEKREVTAVVEKKKLAEKKKSISSKPSEQPSAATKERQPEMMTPTCRDTCIKPELSGNEEDTIADQLAFLSESLVEPTEVTHEQVFDQLQAPTTPATCDQQRTTNDRIVSTVEKAAVTLLHLSGSKDEEEKASEVSEHSCPSDIELHATRRPKRQHVATNQYNPNQHRPEGQNVDSKSDEFPVNDSAEEESTENNLPIKSKSTSRKKKVPRKEDPTRTMRSRNVKPKKATGDNPYEAAKPTQVKAQRKSSRSRKPTDRFTPTSKRKAPEEDKHLIVEYAEESEGGRVTEMRKDVSPVNDEPPVKSVQLAVTKDSSMPKPSVTFKDIMKQKREAKRPFIPTKEDLDEDADGWTSLQIAALRDAYATADPRSDCFWQEVSNHVDGKDSEECGKKWFALVQTPAAKQKGEKKAGAKNVRAKPDAYFSPDEDDIFNATPMRPRFVQEDEEDDLFAVDFGSPIVGKGSSPANGLVDSDIHDEDMQIPVIPRAGYKSYIQNMRRDVSKAEKENRKKKKRGLAKDVGPRTLIQTVDHGDLEVNGRLSPGGTLRLRTMDWNEEEDDFFDSDEEGEW